MKQNQINHSMPLRKLLAIGFLILFLFTSVITVMFNQEAIAQGTTPKTSQVCDPQKNPLGCISNPVKSTTNVVGLFPKIMNIIFASVGLVAVVMVMVGGLRMITGSGNPAQRTKAKETIIWALVGLIITLMSYSIVTIIQNIIKP